MDFLGGAILIDTSAILALRNPKDSNHPQAKGFFEDNSEKILWVVVNVTKHESYTHARYNLNFKKALEIYEFLSSETFFQISFKNYDEDGAKSLLIKYSNEKISFHDALCASIMLRMGIYRVFTFDWHFKVFGFEVFPLYSAF